MPAPADTEPAIRVIFGGDVMLGRMVGDCIHRYGPDYPLGAIAARMRSAALTIVNLECALTSCKTHWSGAPKAFYFGAPPEAALSLVGAGVNIVSLANNHILDFGVAGLTDTLHHLGRHGIAHCGAGVDLDAATEAVTVERAGLCFGMAAFCDHQSDFAASVDKPGIAWLDLSDMEATLPALDHALGALRRRDVDVPILSLHWGPNMVARPSAHFRRLAHAAIDMGWKILFGHSAHVFQGIEIFRGCPIFYATGDLVDDYQVDPLFRNDYQFLFELTLSGSAVQQIELMPVVIDRCQTRMATQHDSATILRRMVAACSEFGVTVLEQDGLARIELDQP